MIYGAKHMKVITIITIFYIVFFLVSLCRVITKKETDEKNKDAELDALSIKFYGKPYKELNDFYALCISMYGNPLDELSGEEQHDLEVVYTDCY